MSLICGVQIRSHDVSAAVIDDKGRPVSVLEMERFLGDKTCSRWSPFSFDGVQLAEYDWDRHREEAEDWVESTSYFWDEFGPEIVELAVASPVFTKGHILLNHGRCIAQILAGRYGAKIKPYPLVVNHHDAHAASAFYQSPFESAKIFSFDGAGNDGFCKFYQGSEHDIEQLVQYRHRFGHTIDILGRRIGDPAEFWPQLSVAGSLMGLHSYGKFNPNMYGEVKEFFDFVSTQPWLNPYGYRELIDGYARFSREQNSNLYWLGECKEQEVQDYVHTFFRFWCDQAVTLLRRHVGKDEPLVLSGGCAMNIAANSRFVQEVSKNLFVPPNPGDAGLSLGAAWTALHVNNRTPREFFGPINPYIGCPVLDRDNLGSYKRRDDYKGKVSLERVAELLQQQKIIGVVQGNSEIGPRALGNRSILADPSNPKMKDRINNGIKYRAWYRPYAPVVRLEEVDRYFDFAGTSQFMSFSAPVKESVKEKIPAVTHVDGTARLQTVTKQQHEFLYDLLSIYDSKYGLGVLLNTSLNGQGKPLVARLSEAFDLLDKTELDGLLIDSKHLWLQE